MKPKKQKKKIIKLLNKAEGACCRQEAQEILRKYDKVMMKFSAK